MPRTKELLASFLTKASCFNYLLLHKLLQKLVAWNNNHFIISHNSMGWLGLSWAVLLVISLEVSPAVRVSYGCGLNVWCSVASFEVMPESTGLFFMISLPTQGGLNFVHGSSDLQNGRNRSCKVFLVPEQGSPRLSLPLPCIWQSSHRPDLKGANISSTFLLEEGHVKGGIVWDCLWRLIIMAAVHLSLPSSLSSFFYTR